MHLLVILALAEVGVFLFGTTLNKRKNNRSNTRKSVDYDNQTAGKRFSESLRLEK